MNNKQILELTHHLSQALDQNYDVVNMEIVLAVISNLEGTTITKEQLETTRLAKYINQLRRRTNNENLARRSKSLLKKWREMVGMQQSGVDSQQQQPTIQQTTSPIISATVTLSVDNAPNRQTSQPTSPLAPSSSAEQTIEPRADCVRTATNCSTNVSPTSFSNLINNLSSSNNNMQQRVMAGADYNSNAGLKTKTVLHAPYMHQQQQKRTETFVIDHSSNSNSISNFGSTFVNRSKIEEMPIVIDIDSDSQESESTRLQQQQKNVVKTNIAAVTAMPLIQPVSGTKVKKAKKEKKRKEKDTQCKVAGFAKISSMSNDERSSSNTTTQLTQKHKNERSSTTTMDGDIFVNAKEKKQQTATLPNISSMSEILSLSNSSMSSIFPSDSALISLKNKSSAGVDLTFTGKFKTSHNAGNNSASAGNNLSAAATTTTINGAEALELNYVSGDSSNTKAPKQTKSLSALTNDENSTSSSQNFPFDVIDVVSQDNNQSKMIEELRLQSNASLQQSGGSSALELCDSRNVPTTDGNRDSATITTKMPKKRGRKKGSKGVDSIITQETSLSQQIFGSGGKKVKTTKELFNEIQNRKLGFGVSNSSYGPVSATQKSTLHTANTRQANQKIHGIQSSRPASSCSEPSLHSPRTMDAYLTNATVSTGGATRSSTDNVSNLVEDGLDSESDTMTSEPSRDGVKQSKLNRTTSLDSNSSSQFEPSTLKSTTKRPNKTTLANLATKTLISGAEAQLREIVLRLPLPDQTQLVEEQYTAKLVTCTCVLIEESPKEETLGETVAEEDGANATVDSKAMAGGGVPGDMLDTAATHVQNQKTHYEQTNAIKEETVMQPVVLKPKKSIFDLDFDEDDDPLQSLIAEAAVAAGPIKIETTAHDIGNIKSELLTENEEGLSALASATTIQEQITDNTENILVPPLLLYRVEEDPNCMAKQRYDLQTNQITNFHIDALHNCYIPNVNGNWDDAALPTTTTAQLMHYDYDVTDGADVVPQYGCLINERIPKDLSQLSFRKEVKTMRPKFQNMPFLGVAKCLPSCRRQKRTLRRLAKHAKSEKLLDTNDAHAVAIKIENAEDDLCKKDTAFLECKPKTLEINVCDSAPFQLTDQQQQQQQQSEVIITTDGNDFTSHDLLAIANSKKLQTNNVEPKLKPCFQTDDDIKKADDELNREEKLSSRRSSSCSNTSLQKTQNSINEKLRQHQRLKNYRQSLQTNNDNYQEDNSVAKRKRKKRKKISARRENGGTGGTEEENVKKQRKIKRIRIAINGNIATQRQISLVSSSNNNTSTDDDVDDDSHNIMSSAYSDDDDSDDEDKISYRNIVVDDNDSDSYYAEVEGGDGIGDSDIEVESVQSLATVESIMPDEEETALDVDNDYDVPICADQSNNFVDEYAIVQRPMGDSGSNNNHIVLTIKKTPSKTNSPANSLSAISPVIPAFNGVSNANDVLTTLDTDNVAEAEQIASTVNGYALVVSDNKMTEIVLPEGRVKPDIQQQRQQHACVRRRRKCRVPRLDIQLNNLFPVDKLAATAASACYQLSTRKTHRKLFFADELLVRNDEGRKECILNCSSCNSSCAEESDFEYYTTSSADDQAADQNTLNVDNECEEGLVEGVNCMIRSCTSSTSSSSSSSSDSDDRESESTHEDDNDMKEATVDTAHNGELSKENNGLLPSFNVLSTECPNAAFVAVKEDGVGGSEVDVLQQSNSLPNKNCDDYNNLYNNNNINLNVIKYNLVNNSNFKNNNNNKCSDGGAAEANDNNSCEANNLTSSALVLDNIKRTGTVVHSEYRTGIRTIADDISSMNRQKDDSSLTRVQQFKEWHQVLQLRSYNNELLTVLPYVLLE